MRRVDRGHANGEFATAADARQTHAARWLTRLSNGIPAPGLEMSEEIAASSCRVGHARLRLSLRFRLLLGLLRGQRLDLGLDKVGKPALVFLAQAVGHVGR